MNTPTSPSPTRGRYEISAYFAIAFGLTWALDLPLARAWMARVAPSPGAMAMAGLSAWGPTLAAVAVSIARGNTRAVFNRWRTNPVWILLALFMPMAVHVVANALEVALGGHPAHWFYPPARPEDFAALVMFSTGEEFGWRGFAYPRLVEKYGLIPGNLLLGVGWALWHLVMMVSPDTGAYQWQLLLQYTIELPLYCVVMAWLFERGNRSMAVAIAAHAGAHLDNVSHGPPDEIRLRVLRVVVVFVAALVAGRSLNRRAAALPSGATTNPAPSAGA